MARFAGLLIDRLGSRAGGVLACSAGRAGRRAPIGQQQPENPAGRLHHLLPVGIAPPGRSAWRPASAWVLASLITGSQVSAAPFHSDPAYYGLKNHGNAGGQGLCLERRHPRARRRCGSRRAALPGARGNAPSVYVADAARTGSCMPASMRACFPARRVRAFEARFEREAETNSVPGGFSPTWCATRGRPLVPAGTGPIPWGSIPTSGSRSSRTSPRKDSRAHARHHLEKLMHESARLATLAETASTLAHEINQPLMVIATLSRLPAPAAQAAAPTSPKSVPC